MKPLQTHYDKLKVARDAPNEVIRAAYKSLSQKYHPDRNQGNEQAARMMSEINVAYDVLSDLEKRKFYDMQLRQQELAQESANQRVQPNPRPASPQHAQTPPPYYEEPRQYEQHPPIENIMTSVFGSLLRNKVFLVIALVCLWSWFGPKTSLLPTSSPSLSKTQKNSTSAKYVRSETAPNGHRWPQGAGYIEGYEQSQRDGYSTVTVDNSQNDSDVYVNLMHAQIGRIHAVRYFYIPAYGKFTATRITTGLYNIRYQDLTTGEFSKSKPFILQETATANGIKNSNVTITIYKVSRDKK